MKKIMDMSYCNSIKKTDSMYDNACVSLIHGSPRDGQFARRTYYYMTKGQKHSFEDLYVQTKKSLQDEFPRDEINIARTFSELPDSIAKNFCIGFKHKYCPHGLFVPESWNMVPSNMGMLICEVIITNERLENRRNSYTCSISGFIDKDGAETFSKTFKKFADNVSKRAFLVKWSIDGSYNELFEVDINTINPTNNGTLLNEIIVKTDADVKISLTDKTALVFFKDNYDMNAYLMNPPIAHIYEHWYDCNISAFIFELISVFYAIFNLAYQDPNKSNLMVESWSLLNSSPLVYGDSKYVRSINNHCESGYNTETYLVYEPKLDELMESISKSMVFSPGHSATAKFNYTVFEETDEFDLFRKVVLDNKETILRGIENADLVGNIIDCSWFRDFVNKINSFKSNSNFSASRFYPLPSSRESGKFGRAGKIYYKESTAQEVQLQTRDNIYDKILIVKNHPKLYLFTGVMRMANLFLKTECNKCSNSKKLGWKESPKETKKIKEPDTANSSNWRKSPINETQAKSKPFVSIEQKSNFKPSSRSWRDTDNVTQINLTDVNIDTKMFDIGEPPKNFKIRQGVDKDLMDSFLLDCSNNLTSTDENANQVQRIFDMKGLTEEEILINNTCFNNEFIDLEPLTITDAPKQDNNQLSVIIDTTFDGKIAKPKIEKFEITNKPSQRYSEQPGRSTTNLLRPKSLSVRSKSPQMPTKAIQGLLKIDDSKPSDANKKARRHTKFDDKSALKISDGFDYSEETMNKLFESAKQLPKSHHMSGQKIKIHQSTPSFDESGRVKQKPLFDDDDEPHSHKRRNFSVHRRYVRQDQKHKNVHNK